ncbi:MAG: hypothetical protein ACRDJU_14825, partial [Actinomycetota bacterium]
MRHVAVVGAFAALLLAACSTNAKVATNSRSPGTQKATSPATRIAGASGATSARGTAREITTVTSTVGGTGSFFSFNGVINFATQQAEITTTVAGATQETISDGQTIYSSIPPAAGAPAGKHWFEVGPSDLAQLSQSGGSSGLGSLVGGEGNSNPSDGLGMLSGVSGTVTTVGSQRIAGVPTTHYRFSADLTKAMQDAPTSDRAALQQMESSVGLANPTVDVWIDGSDVVRQLSFATGVDMNLGA